MAALGERWVWERRSRAVGRPVSFIDVTVVGFTLAGWPIVEYARRGRTIRTAVSPRRLNMPSTAPAAD